MSDDSTVPAGLADTADATSASPFGGGTAPGGTLGRFVILGVLGSGGMGVVLSAFDPELDRKVAIKVLRSMAGGQSRTNLQREAQAMAKVSHPNTVTVHEVGRANDHLFIAMELVEGTTLKAWLAAEKRTWRDVVAMFVAAGHGLVAVHEAGIVHRDFKPENVLIGKDGRPRVSDFGLAESGGTDSTRFGGTPLYMAPEQWTRGELDARTDQFAFCVALWMGLFGQAPFDGSTPEELEAAVLAGKRRVRTGPAAGRDVPGWLVSIVDRGLSIAPAARWPTMKALLDEIDRRATKRRRAWIAAGTLALVVVSGGVAIAAMAVAGDAPPPRRTVHFAALDAKRVTFNDGCEEFPVLSPDGKTVYFDGQVGADSHLFAADTATWTARELTQTAGWDFAAAISPDGRTLAFLRNGQTGMTTYVADVLPGGGLGPPRKIASGPVRPVWSPDGTRLWGGDGDGVISYDVATGVERRRIVPPAGTLPIAFLELRDGRTVMLGATVAITSLADAIFVFPADSGAPKKIYSGQQTLEEVLTLAPEGDAVFVAAITRSGDSTELVRVPLDGGPAVPMGNRGVSARKRLSISTATGRAVWSDCRDVTSLAVVQTDGGGTHLVDLPHGAWGDTFPKSIAGTTRLVFLSDRTDGLRIWEIDRAKAGPARRIPFGDVEPVRIAISHDGTMVAGAEGETGLWVGPVDGSSPPRKLAPDPGDLSPAFSHDGTQIYFDRTDGNLPRLAVVPVAGGEVTWGAPAPSQAAASSPVDDRLAYLTHTAGIVIVRIVDLKTHETRDLVVPGPQMPWDLIEWSPDATKLLVVRNDAHFVELDVATGKSLRTFASGNDMLAGATYAGDEIVVARSRWLGDLWMTNLVR